MSADKWLFGAGLAALSGWLSLRAERRRASPEEARRSYERRYEKIIRQLFRTGRNPDINQTIVCHNKTADSTVSGGAGVFIWGGESGGTAPPGGGVRIYGKRKYRRAVAVALDHAWQGRCVLESMLLEAEVYYATQDAAWQEGPKGARYLAQMRGVREMGAHLAATPEADVEVLR